MAGFTKLGEYTILSELGKGGMGVVYKARQESLARLVALKVLPEGLTQNEEFVKRFVREARAAAHMVHPNVIQIYSVGEDQGFHYYAMEYVEGHDLSRKLRDGFKPTWEEATDIVMEVAKALSCAEEAGIVHRDIKPANVMIDKRGQVKVMDFGLAKAFSEETVMVTQPGMVVGTVAYMSPEQGKGEDLDGRSDQYSLGILYYELLTGRLPFKGDSPTSVIYMHIHEPPPPPRSINPTVPEGAERAVLRMIAKRREDRYPDARELIEHLKAVKKQTSVGMTIAVPSAASSAMGEELPTEKTMILSGGAGPVRKRKGVAVLGVAMALLVAGGAGAVLFFKRPPSKMEPSLASKKEGPMPERLIPVDFQSLLPREAMGSEVALSLNGKRLEGFPRELKPGRHEIEIKRPYYKSVRIQLVLNVGEEPRLSNIPPFEPSDNEVFTEVQRRLEEADGEAGRTKNFSAALSVLEEQRQWVKQWYPFNSQPLAGEKLLSRYGAYWRASGFAAEGNWTAARNALEAAEQALEARERELLARVIAQAAATQTPPATSDPPKEMKRFSVRLSIILPDPGRLPPGKTKVFLKGDPLEGPPWPDRELEAGSHSLVFQNPYFAVEQIDLQVDTRGNPALSRGVQWRPDAGAISRAVEEILIREDTLGRGEEALGKRLAAVTEARSLAQTLYVQYAGSQVPDTLAKRIEGRETSLKAAQLWQEGKGDAVRAESLLASVELHLDPEGKALLETIRRSRQTQTRDRLMERVEASLRRGLLDEASAHMKELGSFQGESAVQSLARRLDEAKSLRGEIDLLKAGKQYALALEKVAELRERHCRESAVLDALRQELEDLKQADSRSADALRRQVQELLAQARAAFQEGRYDDALSRAQAILRDEPDHPEATQLRADASRRLFEAGAQEGVRKALETLATLFQKGGSRDKEAYQELFTPEGWKGQVDRRATAFFDGPLTLVSSRFENVVYAFDPGNLSARTRMEWIVSARYGSQTIEDTKPLSVEWRRLGGVWRIHAVEERVQ